MDLGEHRLKDLQRPSHFFQLSLEGLPIDFPPLKTLDRPGYERAVTKARAQVGKEVFARAWAEGRTMTPEQALINPATLPLIY